jgi:hypothetical protein
MAWFRLEGMKSVESWRLRAKWRSESEIWGKEKQKKKKKGGGVWGCFLPQPGNALSMTVRPALFPLDLY